MQKVFKFNAILDLESLSDADMNSLFCRMYEERDRRFLLKFQKGELPLPNVEELEDWKAASQDGPISQVQVIQRFRARHDLGIAEAKKILDLCLEHGAKDSTIED